MLQKAGRLGRIVYSPTDPDASPVPVASRSPEDTNARYVYLVTRLRNRQITMEEATDLFEIQAAMLRRAPPPPPSDSSDSGSPPPPSAPATAALSVGLPPVDDALWLTLLTLGAGAGVLAAILKRAKDGPRTDDAPAPSGSGRPG